MVWDGTGNISFLLVFELMEMLFLFLARSTLHKKTLVLSVNEHTSREVRRLEAAGGKV